ncbi:M3 family metallopeptidase [uncultured Thiothrix sp.]|uniref:M3 family metallopeptidase n=1 Tax=uncultured Thiothrix sp. TaxID=223185 RepID=UPI0026163B94|nr:M3 family metallopeptidase [uncultured Thiothrix sp.]HMT92418.1 M3 family metallopeptidase [Thiolinea sp.]
MHNPLLQTDGLPQFSAIQAEHVEPALEQVLKDNREWLASRLAAPMQASWDNLIYPLDEAGDRLERVWSPVSHLNAVANTESLRIAYNACLPKLSDYHTDMGQNQALYEAVKAVADAEPNLELSQKHALARSLLSFRLSGVALPEDKKQRYREISQQLSSLSSKFSDNILDATNAWFKQVSDLALLKGIPESGLDMAQQAAQQRHLDGWVFTLDFPSYYSVVAYADNRELRAELYRAYTTRASDLGTNSAWDNTQTMRDILRLRQEEAELLGFANYAEVSLAMKMADTTQEVVDFLEDLAKRCKPFAELEFAELKVFAQEQLGINDVQAWDVTYISEKMKEARFDFTDEDLKPYFPVNKVIQGLFGLVERLYSVRIQQSTAVDVWHPDVTFYQVYELDGSLRAEFYLDLYARQHKRGGAWMSDYCGRFKRKDGVQIPVAFMTCNGTPPVGDKPALFTHDEVVTLFHEFGHGLHHMLTKVDYPDIAGINGVEWDAVELPSQFMENWCWEPEVLNMISGHWQTDAPLPKDLFNKMQTARHFQTAMAMVRQLEFALFDMRLHMDPQAAEPRRLEQIQSEVRKQVAVVQPPVFNRMAHSFSHIFSGGYAAGYYSYKWAEVLSADAYARFEEEGLFAAEVGQAFLEEILQTGGSRPAMESFIAFRGRKPHIDALLRHSGLVQAA